MKITKNILFLSENGVTIEESSDERMTKMTKEVAVTIILETSDNRRLFLMKEENDTLDFVKTTIQKDQTGLASVLEHFKQTTSLPVKELRLTELINMKSNGKAIPFFVFELKGDFSNENHYVWSEEKEFTCHLEEVNLDGLPFF